LNGDGVDIIVYPVFGLGKKSYFFLIYNSMKYLKSYKLFERVTVPDFEISTDCGTCLATKSGKALKSLPKQTSPSSDDSQNSNKPSLKGQQIDPFEVEKQKFLKNNPGAEKRINKVFNSSKKWYTDHYKKEETLEKFENKANRDKLVNFINEEIKLKYWNRNCDSEMSKIWEKQFSKSDGWVWPSECQMINLNMENHDSDPYYIETIPHELGHCIYYKLKQLGEDPISGNKDASTSISPTYINGFSEAGWTDGQSKQGFSLSSEETYLTSEPENQTRLMKLRMILNIGLIDTCEQIKQKFEENIKNGNLKFNFLTPSEFIKNKNGDCYWLKLKVVDEHKGWSSDKKYYIGGKGRLALIYDLLKCSLGKTWFRRGRENLDLQRLFSVFSEYKDGFIWLDLSKLTQFNRDVVTNDSPDDFNKMG
jgi:hypothetical protein